MISRLQRKLTLLVIAVLVAVTAGIVFFASYANYRDIDQRAYAALRQLALEPGGPPERQTGAEDRPEPPELKRDTEGAEDRPEPPEPRLSDPLSAGGDIASLFTSYTIRLNGSGGVEGWTSGRADLYDDAQIEALAAEILAQGRAVGRAGTQYFRIEQEAGGGRRLIVLDARLERLAARSMTRAIALSAGLACALLCAGAWLLIRQMVKPVRQAFERQKQFVWDASHEFKTPLAVISANAEVLAADIGENEYLGYIQSEVKRTDRLVQSLLTLARMDKGTLTARMARVDLSKALLAVALPFESSVFEAGRRLEMDVPEGVCVRGDAEMLQQLAVILLSNALKYSNEGGVIRLTLRQRGRGCQFSVYNTGEGIAPENLERIFDRFYREDLSHSRDIAGNGLGLAIARSIVQAHRGRIRAESTPGQSAEFIVTLP